MRAGHPSTGVASGLLLLTCESCCRLSSTAVHQQGQNLLRCAERPQRSRQVFAGTVSSTPATAGSSSAGLQAALDVLVGSVELVVVIHYVCAKLSFAVQVTSDQPLFNRSLEQKSLADRLSSDPNRAGVTVIVGPPSCGKTALVEHLIAERSQPQQPIYIDCRSYDVKSPDSFAEALLEATIKIGQQRQDVAYDVASALFRSLSEKLKLPGMEVDFKLKPISDLIAQLKSRPGGTPLSQILRAFYVELADKATASPAIDR